MRWILIGIAVLGTIIAVFTVHKYYCQQVKPQLFVVNVLDAQLYNECHIQGSIHIPFGKVRSWAKKIPKESSIVVYCSNYLCGASSQAARQLRKMGFTDVYAYEAGMHEWYHAGLPVKCIVESDYLRTNNPVPEKSNHQDIAVVSTDELKKMMTGHGFFN